LIRVPFNVANVLTVGRIVAAPCLLVAAWHGRHDIFFGLALYCMLSDIFDGKIARALGQQSDFGARLDSWADLLMVLAGPFCAWWLEPQLFASEALWVAIVVGGNLLAIAIGFVKYRRLTSYHTRAARLMAYLAGGGAIVAITWGWPWLFRVGAAVAIYSLAEEIAITAVLPTWTPNVRTLAHARSEAFTTKDTKGHEEENASRDAG
jgi:CDP-diacylglycerol--glycerol-3-phosphate 3-phosphatidyltransferase